MVDLREACVRQDGPPFRRAAAGVAKRARGAQGLRAGSREGDEGSEPAGVRGARRRPGARAPCCAKCASFATVFGDGRGGGLSLPALCRFREPTPSGRRGQVLRNTREVSRDSAPRARRTGVGSIEGHYDSQSSPPLLRRARSGRRPDHRPPPSLDAAVHAAQPQRRQRTTQARASALALRPDLPVRALPDQRDRVIRGLLVRRGGVDLGVKARNNKRVDKR